MMIPSDCQRADRPIWERPLIGSQSSLLAGP
jgi:hypothetical protein